ncbi:hypothetical protein N7507_003032 [Penicillium longicatenatum]|nr:hypothetical protein N7507_003032 [Penicillium longicatenatum]
MSPEFQASNALCAESIVLIYLLHKIPEPPSQKRTSQLTSSNQNYILPFSKERDLVEILSFLSKNRDGSDYIPAVCVEQDRTGNHLKVLLAVNKGTWDDGDDILQSIKGKFEGVFDALHKANYSRHGISAEIKAEVLKSIVIMCSSRILCRLRLAPSKRYGTRSSIKELLQRAIEGVRLISPHKFRNSTLVVSSTHFISVSKEVIRLVNNWLNHHVESRLAEILGAIRSLNEVPSLSDLLHLIPTGKSGIVQDSCFASSLINIISKVARYHEAAEVLYRIAKKYPVVRNMKPQLAILPPEAYDRLNDPSYLPEFHKIPQLLGLINGHRYDVTQISRYMKFPKNSSCSKEFSEETQRTMKESKIHSEIQLIAYCESKSTPELFPRVIASSKDACFLCNAFIATHGKMHTSRTHGRLYPGWRLPNLLHMRGLQKEFNQWLLNQTRKTIDARVAGHGEIHPQPPFESTLLVLLSVSSTTKSESPSDLSSQDLQPSVAEKCMTRQLASSTDSTDSLVVSHKSALREAISSEPSIQNPAIFVSGRLEVHFNMETASASNRTTSTLMYSIERIRTEEKDILPDGSLVVDVMGLTKETQFELPIDNTIYMSCQDVILRLTTGLENTVVDDRVQ